MVQKRIKFLFINIIEKQLVISSSKSQYLALSYIWDAGADNQVQTKQTTLITQ